MSKYTDGRKAWIKETQMFQRIAKQPETSAEELADEYDKMMGAGKYMGQLGPISDAISNFKKPGKV